MDQTMNYLFMILLVLTVIFFILISMPMPKALKEKLVEYLTQSKTIGILVKFHLIICILAGFYFIDLAHSQSRLTEQKNNLRKNSEMAAGTQIRINYLSFSVLKIQRNKYISFMLIFASIALNIFLRLLQKIYKLQEYGQQQLSLQLRKKNSDKVQKQQSIKASSNSNQHKQD